MRGPPTSLQYTVVVPRLLCMQTATLLPLRCCIQLATDSSLKCPPSSSPEGVQCWSGALLLSALLPDVLDVVEDPLDATVLVSVRGDV